MQSLVAYHRATAEAILRLYGVLTLDELARRLSLLRHGTPVTVSDQAGTSRVFLRGRACGEAKRAGGPTNDPGPSSPRPRGGRSGTDTGD